MEVVVLSDTHLRGGLAGVLPGQLMDALARSDAIVHAGDVVSSAALGELRQLGVVHGVLGNNDHELAGVLPEELAVELGGVRIAVRHDSGPSSGRAARMGRRYPWAEVVVFGHSHIPFNEAGVNGQLLFNPGSPTQRRSQPYPTYGRLVLDRGRVLEHVIEPLAVPPARRQPVTQVNRLGATGG